jgi:Na+/H+-dicarboxylate symporter
VRFTWLAFFRQLFPERLAVSREGGLVAVPSEVLAYVLPIILLSIAVGIANTLFEEISKLHYAW